MNHVADDFSKVVSTSSLIFCQNCSFAFGSIVFLQHQCVLLCYDNGKLKVYKFVIFVFVTFYKWFFVVCVVIINCFVDLSILSYLSLVLLLSLFLLPLLIILSEHLVLVAPVNFVKAGNNRLSKVSQVLRACLTFILILIPATYFLKPVDIAPNVPTTTGITFFMPQILAISSLTLFKMEGGMKGAREGGAKRPPTNFSLVTSTNVGISP